MFADSGISDELAEKIIAFVDREAGRDAPLTADDEAMVRQLIEDDPEIRALVDDLRATNAGLDTILEDVATVEVPDKLVALIRGHGSRDVAIIGRGGQEDPAAENAGTGQASVYRGADDGADDANEVVPFHRPPPRRVSYGALAAAASVALLISCGALYQVYTSGESERGRLETALATANNAARDRDRALADARSEIERLASLAEQASGRSVATADALAQNEEAIQALEVERADLQGRFAVLEEENQRLAQTIDQQLTDLAENRNARDRTAGELANAREALADAESQTETLRETLTARVDDLTSVLNERGQEIASLTETLKAREEQSEDVSVNLAELREAEADLTSRLAEVEADRETLQAERERAEQAAEAAQQRLASLEANIEDAESRLATVAAGLTSAEAGRREAVQQVFALEAELAASTSWLGQIAQYHRVYASTARRHLVEVGADELDHIQEWLTKMLGREIVVPDLTEFGVTFAGARLLGINEKPVAQLVYLDADDQPLALCIIPSTGAAKDPTISTNRDLNLVDWRDGSYGYAVVGWSDPALLSSLTDAIQPVYDL